MSCEIDDEPVLLVADADTTVAENSELSLPLFVPVGIENSGRKRPAHLEVANEIIMINERRCS